MKSHDNRIPLAIGIFVTLVSLVVSLGVVYTSYNISVAALDHEIESNMFRMAEVVSTVIDPAQHRKFEADPSLGDSPEYLRYREAFFRILSINDKDLKFIYSMVKKDGQYYFVLDSSPVGHPDSVELMSVYEDPPPDLDIAYTAKSRRFVGEPFTDQWGTFLIAYIPLLDENGGMYAMLAVDMEYHVYLEKLDPINDAAYRGAIGSIIVSLLLGVCVGLSRYMKILVHKTRTETRQKIQPGRSDAP